MVQSNAKTDVVFRFLNLNKLQAFTLKRELLGSSYEAQQGGNLYIGSVPLTNLSLDDINDFYVRQRIAIKQCDIFVTAKISAETPIYDVPEIVNRMIKYIDCQLRFSLTSS